MRLRPILLAAASGLAAAALYLGLYPTRVDPVAYEVAPAPALEGPYARNARLAAAERLGGEIGGPESVAFDAEGRLYSGLTDGRIVRLPADGKGAPETFARTGGRPLGLSFDAAGNLIVADAVKGLLSVAQDGAVTVLATEQGGVPFALADDVVVGRDGTIYFSDASSRWGLDEFVMDILERRPSGRLLAYRPTEKRVDLVLGDLCFPNGVALAPDESYVAVSETSAYRVTRAWLTGPRRGTRDALIENLPGFPDNITLAPSRGHFWLAIGSTRDPVVDACAGWPSARRVIARLPAALRPKPQRHAFVLGVDLEGRVLHNLQHDAPDSYSPLTSVREHQGMLYLGSFAREGIGRIAVPAAPAPPSPH